VPELEKTFTAFQAGFDLTAISALKWQKLLEQMKIADGVETEEKSEWPFPPMRHWTWTANDGFIVTWCNPFTGVHLAPHKKDNYPDQLSYVGIEGTKEFVDAVVTYIKKHATSIEDECYGTRRYI
jgi:hypothetical protein